MVRLARVAGPAALLLAAFVALLAALAIGGGAAAPVLNDPGALVRYGLPVAKLIMNLGVATTLGALALAVFALSAREKEFGRALDIAAAGAAIWAVAGAISALLTFPSIADLPVTFDDSYGQSLGFFLTQTDIGRAWLATVLVGAVATVLCFAVRNVTALLFVAAFAFIGVVPLAEQGHAGDEASHDIAVTAIWLHISFAALWLGGLLTIILLRKQLDVGGSQARLARGAS